MRRLSLLFAVMAMTFGGLAATEPVCAVRLTLTDAESGDPVPGVIRVRDESGAIVAIPELRCRGQGLSDESAIHDWYVITQQRTIRLPQRVLQLTAFSGIETEFAHRRLDLTATTNADVEIPLRRLSDAHARNWWNANTHVHLRRISRPEADGYLPEVGMADGLDLVFVSYLERAGETETYTSNQYSRRELHALDNDHVHFDHGEEHRHNFGGGGEGYGHVMLLNILELIQPVSIGPGISGQGTDSPPLRRGIERALDLGATVIWCHNAWGLEDIPNWLAGRLHANNIFDGGSRGSFEHSFYRYLDCGIKVPFSTGTDWFIYDFSRVYVPHVGRPAPEEWLSALASGRSFITNGPLLEFSIDGAALGVDVSLREAAKVVVRGRAAGRLDFERLELIRNGEILLTRPSLPKKGHYTAELEVSVDIAQPSWLALRTPPPLPRDSAVRSGGPPVNEYGEPLFSHTSATFVDLGGQRIFDREVARGLIDEMKASRVLIGQTGLFADDEERRAVLSTYDEGISTLTRKLGDSGAGGVADQRE